MNKIDDKLTTTKETHTTSVSMNKAYIFSKKSNYVKFDKDF
jgi:hypothetical protein